MNEIEELLKKYDSETFAYPEVEPDYEDEPTADFKDGYNQATKVIIGYLKAINHEPVEVPKFIKNIMQQYNSLQEMLTEEYYSDNTSEMDSDAAFCWIDTNFDLLCRAWLDGYTVAKEPLYIISKSLDTNGIFKNYFVGFVGGMEPLMDCRKKEAYKFSDFEQAKAVAYLICGNVEEEE